jgi:hypothetical protein
MPLLERGGGLARGARDRQAAPPTDRERPLDDPDLTVGHGDFTTLDRLDQPEGDGSHIHPLPRTRCSAASIRAICALSSLPCGGSCRRGSIASLGRLRARSLPSPDRDDASSVRGADNRALDF